MTWGQFLPCQRRSVWKKRTREGDGWEGKACAIATLLIASKILPGHHTIYFSFLSGLSMRYGEYFLPFQCFLPIYLSQTKAGRSMLTTQPRRKLIGYSNVHCHDTHKATTTPRMQAFQCADVLVTVYVSAGWSPVCAWC